MWYNCNNTCSSEFWKTRLIVTGAVGQLEGYYDDPDNKSRELGLMWWLKEAWTKGGYKR